MLLRRYNTDTKTNEELLEVKDEEVKDEEVEDKEVHEAKALKKAKNSEKEGD